MLFLFTICLAKKYAIDQLVSECVRFLLNGLTASNAVSLLAQARLFHENTLIERCFEMIDKSTDIALQSQSNVFFIKLIIKKYNLDVEDIDHDTLVQLLKRTQLDPSSELVVCK